MPGFSPLFSSSKANSSVFFDKSSSIIIDMGSSYKAFLCALDNAGEDLSKIRAIAVTHDHSDHITGLKAFLKNNRVPLIASKGTLDALIAKNLIPAGTDIIIADENDIVIGDIVISRFSTSHDSAGSSGYILSFDGKSYSGICTDTGIVTDEELEHLKKCKSVIIESNHDLTMLKNGPYTPQLKMRILSEVGHLSNNACAEALPKLLESGVTRFVLGHLSLNNNNPMIAYAASSLSLKAAGATENRDYMLSIAKPADNEVFLY